MHKETNLGIDKEEMHLQEGKQRLKNRVGEDDLGNAFTLHCRVHGDLQAVKDQRSQSEN